MEKCAADYGIEEDDWDQALSESLIRYFNEGESAVSESIQFLSGALDMNQKRELVEDLIAIALADEVLHEKERKILVLVCRVFDVHLKVPTEFNIRSL
jgi:uncharacterized tellurite resistance protein B-like protein